MNMTASEKIRILAKRQKLSMGEIAEATKQSRQNLSNKMQRDNFSISELQSIAQALNCKLDIVFTTEDGEKI